ncbi:MAG: Fe-S-containing hydro-lyase [Oscillospiraceae bacterium]|nr:Fe-S-containing hydro-lyase [Oscillospiraceae bacterium]
MSEKIVSLPLDDERVRDLQAGDRVLLNGIMYTGRDEAHLYLCRMLDKGEPLPVDLKGAVIYYVGPCPAKPGQAIGSAGPTTSGRMDAYAPRLMEIGLKGMIGKGMRSAAVIESMKKNTCVYFAATGGAGALLSQSVKEAEVVAFPELGAEAIYRLRVENFPCTVINDCRGRDLYKEGRSKYEIKE